jgi:hypothetical protein
LKEELEERWTISLDDVDVIPLRAARVPEFVEQPARGARSVPTLTSVEAEFEAAGRRLLILGAAGSGKSLSLDLLLGRLVTEAAHSLSAPLPVRLNLSSLPFDRIAATLSEKPLPPWIRHQRKLKHVESWFRDNLPEFAHRSRVTETWLATGDFAWLLDGLDEVPEKYLARTLNFVFKELLPENPDIPVVLCCRTEALDVPVPLQGAIILQPFSDNDIASYLNARNGGPLQEAIERNAALREIARNPLTLRMMLQASRRVDLPGVLSAGGDLDWHRALFRSYVESMLRRFEPSAGGATLDRSKGRINDADFVKGLFWLAKTMRERGVNSIGRGGIAGTLATARPGYSRSFSVPLSTATSIVSFGSALAICAAASLFSGATGSVLSLPLAFGIAASASALVCFVVWASSESEGVFPFLAAAKLMRKDAQETRHSIGGTTFKFVMNFVMSSRSAARTVAKVFVAIAYAMSVLYLTGRWAAADAPESRFFVTLIVLTVCLLSEEIRRISKLAACLAVLAAACSILYLVPLTALVRDGCLLVAVTLLTVGFLHSDVKELPAGAGRWFLAMVPVALVIVSLGLSFVPLKFAPSAIMAGLTAIAAAAIVWGQYSLFVTALGSAFLATVSPAWGAGAFAIVLPWLSRRETKEAVGLRLERWILSPVVETLLVGCGVLPHRWNALLLYARKVSLLHYTKDQLTFAHELILDYLSSEYYRNAFARRPGQARLARLIARFPIVKSPSLFSKGTLLELASLDSVTARHCLLQALVQASLPQAVLKELVSVLLSQPPDHVSVPALAVCYVLVGEPTECCIDSIRPWLSSLLVHPDPVIRAASLHCLAITGDRELAAAAQSLLADEWDLVKLEAIEYCNQAGLEIMLTNSPQFDEALQTILIHRQWELVESGPPLDVLADIEKQTIGFLESNLPVPPRLIALQILTKLGTETARRSVGTYATHPVSLVRLQSVIATFGGKGAESDRLHVSEAISNLLHPLRTTMVSRNSRAAYRWNFKSLNHFYEACDRVFRGLNINLCEELLNIARSSAEQTALRMKAILILGALGNADIAPEISRLGKADKGLNSVAQSAVRLLLTREPYVFPGVFWVFLSA